MYIVGSINVAHFCGWDRGKIPASSLLEIKETSYILEPNTKRATLIEGGNKFLFRHDIHAQFVGLFDLLWRGVFTAHQESTAFAQCACHLPAPFLHLLLCSFSCHRGHTIGGERCKRLQRRWPIVSPASKHHGLVGISIRDELLWFLFGRIGVSGHPQLGT